MEEEKKNNNNWLNNMDVGFLTEVERSFIVDVLKRDEKLKLCEKKRVVQLKCELRDVRRRGAKRADATYSSHICERCTATTGHLRNKGLRCPVCRHKTCENCRVSVKSATKDAWICIVCYKESKIKAKSGEWFYDIMRAELKPMSEGSTLLKEAVIHTTLAKTSPDTSSGIATPDVQFTPPSSTTTQSSRPQEMISSGSMESIVSSAGSHSPFAYSRFRPETGSIESLRSLRNITYKEPYFSDSDQSISTFSLPAMEQCATLPARSKVMVTNDKDVSSLSNIPGSPAFYQNRSTLQSSSYIHNRLSLSTQSIPSNDVSSSRNKSVYTEKKRPFSSGGKLRDQVILSQSNPTLSLPHSSLHSPMMDCMSVPEDNEMQSFSRFRKPMSISAMDISEKTLLNESPRTIGEIKFSLDFDYKSNTLVIFIAECRNLLADFHRKRCDPYIKCYLLPDQTTKKKTSTKKNSTSPNFNQEIKYQLSMAELSNRVLEMSVWNEATFSRNSFLGHVEIAMDTWKWSQQSIPHWFPLKQKILNQYGPLQSSTYRGDLLIAISYKEGDLPQTNHGEVHVMIKQAKHLIPVSSNRKVKAFAKLSLLPGKEYIQKTGVVDGGNSAVWNDTFHLPLQRKIEQCGLQITVWHKNSSTTSRHSRIPLGCIQLSSRGDAQVASSTDEEHAVWNKICSSPGLWVDAALSLKPLL